MKIINSDRQARAVLQLVASIALFFAGTLIFLYRVFEPTQQLLYHSISSSFQVLMIGLGGTVLLRCYPTQKTWVRVSSMLFAVLALAAVYDGLAGSYFDSFHAYIPKSVYFVFLPLVLGQCAILLFYPVRLRTWQRTFLKVNGAVALGIACVSLFLLLLHLFLQSPFLAKHPSGSLIVSIAGMLAGVACYASSYRGRRSLPALSSNSMNFAAVAMLVVLVFGVGMFHNQMNELKREGERSIDQLRETRTALGESFIELFQRLTERWENYPLSDQARLMEVDIAAYLKHVDYLDALLLVNAQQDVMFERLKPSRTSYYERVMADSEVRQTLTQASPESAIIVPEFATTGLTAKLVLYMPVTLTYTKASEAQPFSALLAVVDVRALLGNALVTGVDSDIETYTDISTGRWLDRAGFWVTEPTAKYLEEKAIKLHDNGVDLYYSKGIPTVAYLYRLDSLQRTANLQMLIVVGGIGLVLLVVLVVERNVSLVQQGKQLFYQAHHDALTGLWNRNSIERYIGDQFHDNQDVTVLFIDLDGFTLINDSLGLHVGDAILNQLAERLQIEQPRRSELARFASDEFILVLTGISHYPERVESLAQDLMSIVAQPYRVAEHKVYLTASIGVAHQTDDVLTPLELIQRADMAMHRAKQLGYNYVQEYKPSMAQQMSSATSMRSSLQEAIDNEGLQLHYQPIVRCNDQEVVQYEALLRWPQADGSTIPPAEFIPLAELTGQIIPLSRWVFRQACEDAVRLQQTVAQPRVSVNISALHFNRANFVDFVLKTLAETGCRGSWIELEMTESILLEGSSYAIERLQKLRQHGITIALDDFGTGFSSLSYLKVLPIDIVKIDRSFIAGIHHHKSDRVLIESVIRIAQSLDFAILAEGIETEEQARFVTDLGCNYMQGFYFGKPAPIADASVR